MFAKNEPEFPVWYSKINANHLRDEEDLVEELLDGLILGKESQDRIQDHARMLVEKVRKGRQNQGGIDAFMAQYNLSRKEGIVMMCLAESLLRVPDVETQNALIEDKLNQSHWEALLGKSDSFFVNAGTWALMIGQKMVGDLPDENQTPGIWESFVKRTGEPVVREALLGAMRILGRQFVLGETLDDAREAREEGYLYSYDMLGEAARTRAEADAYFKAYWDAITGLGRQEPHSAPKSSDGVSLKLSALHPRYETAKRARVLSELVPMVLDLALAAKEANINLCIDAEECDRLGLSLEIFEQVFLDEQLSGWDGFGLAVQAYQKRALDVIDFLGELAVRGGREIMVRLVKGAYWDSEIKTAQQSGLEDYPVFTRKSATDLSYLLCVQKIRDYHDRLYGQFATHNALSAAQVVEVMGDHPFEFQRLHGMGTPLHEALLKDHPVRIYAPVGTHEDLLSYLVRRLLENGANSSFVHRLVDDDMPIDEIIADPVFKLQKSLVKRHSAIPKPRDLYGPVRVNARGIDLSDPDVLRYLKETKESYEMDACAKESTAQEIDHAFATAKAQQPGWQALGVEDRAKTLKHAANILEDRLEEFVVHLVLEARKTYNDALAEVREAIDFLRYYSAEGPLLMARPITMAAPTGEKNHMSFAPKGVFACISPWNFPLAIFTGQVSAALITGNAVVAKPAEQTPRVAQKIHELFLEAGLPEGVMNLVYGTGERVGTPLLTDRRLSGVCFTGSLETAKMINRTLSERNGAIVPLIAETGGLNAMIIDSTALLETTVLDVVGSAFGAAGQRCSALRVAYVQLEIFPEFREMLVGAMQELTLDEPSLLATDVGPLIDQAALERARNHLKSLEKSARFVGSVETRNSGTYFAPHVFEIKSIEEAGDEVFAPILHLIPFLGEELDKIIDDINQTGYGLTGAIQTRIDSRAEKVSRQWHVGNFYVNRPMVSAVVGMHPFGGEGLSGTGFKAGGPNYLLRFINERSVSINTAASGGNAELINLDHRH